MFGRFFRRLHWKRKVKVKVSVDIGGSTGKIALLHKEHAIAHAKFAMSGDADQGVEGVFWWDVGRIVEIVKRLADACNVRVVELGIAVPGKVSDDGMTLTSGNLTWWVGQPIVQKLREHFKRTRIVLGNDALGAG
jgi:predicted NBD/HSP70 family sugar kinase